MTAPTRPTIEVYMLLTNRKRLARLIEIQEISKRSLAQAAGWKSHSYLHRLLSGEARTVTPDAAAKIAHKLGVDIGDLFTTKVTSVAGQTAKQNLRRAA